MNNKELKIIIRKNVINIKNYYNIIYKEDIENILEDYRHKYNSSVFYNYIINKRSVKSMVYQWGAFNLFHLFKYNKKKNISFKEIPLYKILIYYIFGWIWFKFNDKYDL